MAATYFWKGYLKLSLVTCPVSLTPATSDSEKVKFHTINRKTGRRVKTRYVDAVTGKPVKQADEVKGYETEDGKFVTFTDDELDSVRLESVRTIDIDTFVKADDVPWHYYDNPYYVLPNDKVGEEAYAVIREAMKAKGVAGLARLVMFRRERQVMLTPKDDGLVLWTLRYGEEVRGADDYLPKSKEKTSDASLLKMIGELIGERETEWAPKLVQDPVQKRLKQLISAKQKGRKATPKKAPAPRPSGSNVVDLMAALKKSMDKAASKPSARH